MCMNNGYRELVREPLEITYKGKRHEMVKLIQEDFYEVDCFV